MIGCRSVHRAFRSFAPGLEALMGLMQEFKEFAVKGNAVDMAVGIIIGAAFGKVISSLVNDVIMPPIGLLVGGTNFKDLAVVLKEGVVDEAGVVVTEQVA